MFLSLNRPTDHQAVLVRRSQRGIRARRGLGDWADYVASLGLEDCGAYNTVGGQYACSQRNTAKENQGNPNAGVTSPTVVAEYSPDAATRGAAIALANTGNFSTYTPPAPAPAAPAPAPTTPAPSSTSSSTSSTSGAAAADNSPVSVFGYPVPASFLSQQFSLFGFDVPVWGWGLGVIGAGFLLWRRG